MSNSYKDPDLKPYQKLELALDAVWQSQTFLDFITFQRKVYSYSWNNRLLIWSQNPEARLVFGFKKWQELGRWVMKGESAIGILIPMAYGSKDDPAPGEDQPKGVRFMWRNCLFDISQTDGAELPDMPVPALPVEGADGLFQLLRRVSENQFSVPVSIQEPRHGEYGSYSPKQREIRIATEFSDGVQALATMSHELAHHLTPELTKLPRDEAEVIAEVAAYAVCAHFGHDIGARAVPYIATWGESKPLFLKGMPVAQSITSQLIDAIEKEAGTCLTQSTESSNAAPVLAA